MPGLLFIFGTRPEAIKLCPIISHLREHAPELKVSVCSTAQHRELVDQVLEVFRIEVTYDLNVMLPNQTLAQLNSRILAAAEPVIKSEMPGMVVVQGDTTSTLAGALAAFYCHVPVAHVEAGLRTGDLAAPFPEELNRVLTTRLAKLHFAPTEQAKQNLVAESVDPSSIYITGNTGIDSLLYVTKALEDQHLDTPVWPWLNPLKHLLLITAHRRESFGIGMENICTAVRNLAARQDVQIVFPVHPNPNVRKEAARHLDNVPNVVLLPPLDYVSFVDLMRRARILITDSGGVQEEGPSLGKPILVLRDKTERPEAVQAGTVTLVGTDAQHIIKETECLLEDQEEYRRRSFAHNPYGDGHASRRITQVFRRFFKIST
jgi:UDP-N-acetylglucosamine 2-epimerase (non-hydrolysing)